jgi:primosomal protein N' (replication factor Y)
MAADVEAWTVSDDGEQLELLRQETKSAKPPKPVSVAAELPVARVAVDVPLPHLDRPFDYLVPEEMAEAAQPGVRVKVRFAGQAVDGFLVERVATSEHPGVLARLQRVVSPEPVLSPEILELAREVAARWSGTLADVLRLAVPPRHARVEQEADRAPAPALPVDPGWAAAWADYEPGPEFLRALAQGRPARAVWAALPATSWAMPIAAAVATCAAAGRGALVVVPDQRDLAPLGAALEALLGRERHLSLTADLGPAERYRRWLAVRRGQVRVVIGTRAAMFAPVADLGLVVCWDDGDDLHAEPRAPYPYVREVLCLRAHNFGAAALFGGHGVTAEAAGLIQTGWAKMLIPNRDTLRARQPMVRIAGADAELARDEAARAARLPSVAWQTARAGLAEGPVLVQVPRRGYLPVVACVRCRAAARCGHCGGPLGLASARGPARCSWCGRDATDWHCQDCDATTFRAAVVGTQRTAEELGRAFPGAVVRWVDGDNPGGGPAGPALIVATPGAEPAVAGGYAAVLLLDGQLMLGRPDLRVAEETLRRWLNAAALARPGAPVVLVAQSASPAAQALVRWDPFGFATRELADRAAAAFPPAVRVATVSGIADSVAELLHLAELPDWVDVLGPTPVHGSEPPTVRAVLRVHRAQGAALSAALRAAAGVRSARKSPGPVRVQIDPVELG